MKNMRICNQLVLSASLVWLVGASEEACQVDDVSALLAWRKNTRLHGSTSVKRQKKCSAIKYKAAVVEIESEDPRSWNHVLADKTWEPKETAKWTQLRNIIRAEALISEAAAQGAQLVVLPEDYVSSGAGLLPYTDAENRTRHVLHLYSETLPLPGPSSLCTEGKSETPVLDRLACAAIKYNVLLVTGMGSTGPCVNRPDPFTGLPYPCNRTSNTSWFNTIVALGHDGALLASYQKRHLARSWDSASISEVWAEQDRTQVVSFESHFGVKFGMFICNDINFGGPARKLLKEGITDFIFPTLWINSVSWAHSLGVQDSFSRAYQVNLIAANQDWYGQYSSGSGIWPADSSKDFVQRYNTGGQSRGGWLGVLELTSPEKSAKLPPAVYYTQDFPVMGDDGTVIYKSFSPVANETVALEVAAENVTCRLHAEVSQGVGPEGIYILLAESGLTSGGWYSAQCVLAACYTLSHYPHLDCLYIPTEEIPGGGAKFSSLRITMTAPLSNTFFPSALCQGGTVPQQRSALTVSEVGEHRTLSLAADCALQVAYFDSRAMSENETAVCPSSVCSSGATAQRATALQDATRQRVGGAAPVFHPSWLR